MTTRLIYTLIFLSLISCQSKVDYEPMGAYKYEITNDLLFEHTAFSAHSFGYGINDLNINNYGITIHGTDTLSKNEDYIVAMKPVVSALEFDDSIDWVPKKALEVILKDTIVTDSLYIYRLRPKGTYRLMMP